MVSENIVQLKLAATLLCDNIRRQLDHAKFVGAVYIDLSVGLSTPFVMGYC